MDSHMSICMYEFVGTTSYLWIRIIYEFIGMTLYIYEFVWSTNSHIQIMFSFIVLKGYFHGHNRHQSHTQCSDIIYSILDSHNQPPVKPPVPISLHTDLKEQAARVGTLAPLHWLPWHLSTRHSIPGNVTSVPVEFEHHPFWFIDFKAQAQIRK